MGAPATTHAGGPVATAAGDGGIAARRAAADLVGRDRELAQLVERLASGSGAVFVSGEAGTGKTRLVNEALARSNRQAFVGHCHPVSEPFPLGPIVEALRRALGSAVPARPPSGIVGALRPLVPELADLLPPSPGPMGDAQSERHRTLRALVDLFGSFDECVLVLEDAHWADTYTCDFLQLLFSEMPSSLVVVLTYRTEDLPGCPALRSVTARPPVELEVTRVSLAPLPVEAVASLVSSLLNAPDVSDAFARFLHARTAGIPFAVEEVVRLLVDRADLVRRGDGWVRRSLEALDVPDAVRDSVLERAGRLSPAARAVTDAAAAIGRPAPPDLIARVAGIPLADALSGLGEGVESAVLRDYSGGCGFRHDLACQAIYEAIPGPKRALLHSRAAAELALSDRYAISAELAHHYHAAGDLERWVEAAEQAAERAIEVHDHAGACRLLATVLAEGELTPEQRGRVARSYGYAGLHGLAPREAARVLTEVIDDPLVPPATRGELRFYLSGILGQSGDAHSARQHDLVSLDELPEASRLRPRTLAGLAFVHSPTGELAEHLAWMERAKDALAATDDAVSRTAVAVDEMSLLMDVGDPRCWALVDALEIPEEGSRRIEIARGYANMAQAALLLGYGERSAFYCAQTLRLCGEECYDRFVDDMTVNALQRQWAAGEWQGLREQLERVAQSTRHCPKVWAKAQVVLAGLSLAEGRPDEADAVVEAVVDLAVDAGVLWAALSLLGVRARTALLRDDTRSALEAARRGAGMLRQKGVWVWAAGPGPAIVECLTRAGAHDEARAFVREMEAGLAGRDAPAAIAALLECTATLHLAAGDDAAALAAFEAAAAAYSVLPALVEEVRAHESAGAAGAERYPEEAERHFAAATELASSAGAAHDLERVVRTMRARGFKVARPWRGGRRGYGDELSPRQKEIAGLAARGHTNKEIADALFISHKTVGHHLESAMKKLGVTSRRELARLEGLERN